MASPPEGEGGARGAGGKTIAGPGPGRKGEAIYSVFPGTGCKRAAVPIQATIRPQAAPSMRRLLLHPLLVSLAACRGKETARPERRPLAGAAKGWNVVLLTVDTLRADRLGSLRLQGAPQQPAGGRPARLGRRVRERDVAAGLDLAVARLGADRPLSERPRGQRERLRLPRRPADPAQAAARRRLPDRGVPQQHVPGQPPGVGRPSPAPAARTARTSAGRSSGRRDGRSASARSSSGSTCSAPTPPTTTAATGGRMDPGYQGPLGPRKRAARPGDDDAGPAHPPRRPASRRPLRRRRPGERPAQRRAAGGPAGGRPAGADDRHLQPPTTARSSTSTTATSTTPARSTRRRSTCRSASRRRG